MGNLISKIQSISGVLSIFLLIVVIALLVCVVSLFLEVNRLNQKYRVFMKGRDGQSLEKSFRRKFAMIDKGLDAAAANEQEIEKLKEGLKHLGPEDRALLEGKYLLKYGDKELARDFGCQPNSIRMKLTRARRKLMVIMKRSKKDDKT